MVEYLDQETISLKTLIKFAEDCKQNCQRNGYDIENVPVTITHNRLTYAIDNFGLSFGIGSKGAVFRIELDDYNKCMPIVNDVRPEAKNAEYWYSRGASSFDVSGFVKSKPAGERLLRMVKYILEKDEVETWLDWREYEPEWIQFKFSANEFDVLKLSNMAKENNDIITEDIIRACVKQ